MENGVLVGIISIEDLIEALAGGEMGVTVEKKMTRDPVFLYADEPVVMAVNRFSDPGFGRFPIVDNDKKLIGILTRGDIIEGLLKKLEVEHHEEEIRHYRVSHIFEDIVSDCTSLVLRYNIMARDLEHAGEASSNIKLVLTRLDIPTQLVRRAAIAAYEAEMNIVLHADEGGEIVAEVQPGQIVIRVTDTGPGIADIEQAMQPGFSTASEWMRELGFGAGMGLPNIRSCVDEMRLESSPGNGTLLEAVIYLNREGDK
jgi:anti-sigma regulatory factor (Ser/Thr protein kinase)